MNEAAVDIPTWMSIVFTILCGLVAALITWQIYQSINLDKKLRNVRKETKKQFADYDKHVASSVCLAMGKVSAHSHLIVSALNKTSNALNQALDHVAQAFENINQCTIKDNIPSAYEALNSLITTIENQLSWLLRIETSTLQRVIKAIMQDNSNIGDIDKINVLNRLMELQRKLELLKKESE